MKIEDKYRGHLNENGRGKCSRPFLRFTSRRLWTHDDRKRVRGQSTNRENGFADCSRTLQLAHYD
eukprot:187738-Heterocapsa_arctica.AAC.1